MPRKKPILITSNNEKQSLHMFKIFILRKATLVKPLLFIFLGFSDEEMPKIHGRHLSLSTPPGDKQSKGICTCPGSQIFPAAPYGKKAEL